MQHLTEELRASLHPFTPRTGNPNPTVYAKFFTPDSNWTWFITEGGAEEELRDALQYVVWPETMQTELMETTHDPNYRTLRGS